MASVSGKLPAAAPPGSPGVLDRVQIPSAFMRSQCVVATTHHFEQCQVKNNSFALGGTSLPGDACSGFALSGTVEPEDTHTPEAFTQSWSFAGLPEFLRWCVLSTEENHKCSEMAIAFKGKKLMPEIQCVSAESQEQCMEQIQVGPPRVACGPTSTSAGRVCCCRRRHCLVSWGQVVHVQGIKEASIKLYMMERAWIGRCFCPSVVVKVKVPLDI